ncbi:MAG: hypothetical protein AB4040_03890 [Synechococcus sp.]
MTFDEAIKIFGRSFSIPDINASLSVIHRDEGIFSLTSKNKFSNDSFDVYIKSSRSSSLKLPTIKHKNSASCRNNKIFISGNYNSNLKIKFLGSNSNVFLCGNTKWCKFSGLVEVRDNCDVIIGKGISSNDIKINVSHSGILLGDDCMFASGVEIRTHSGHVFINTETNEIATRRKSLHIEPHVWVGQKAKIFMCPKIGACSVIGYGALVTSEVPRMSSAKGFPAISKPTKNLWARNRSPRNIKLAQLSYKTFVMPS